MKTHSSRVIVSVAAISSFLLGSPARATFHFWNITEVYSNADGTVQYIELFTTANNQQSTLNHTIRSSSGPNSKDFVFPSNTPSPTAGHFLLLATSDFASLPGSVTPDFTLDDGFLFTSAGTVDFLGANIVSYLFLPTDGISSLHCTANNGIMCTATSVNDNTPTNYAGAIGSIDASGGCTDNDGDGFGSPGNATCPGGAEEDCDDFDDTAFPGNVETCDDIIDNDCNGRADCDDSACDGHEACPPGPNPPVAGASSSGRALALAFPPASDGAASGAGALTAYRVTLVSLYHPADPQPVDQPDYSGSEGQVRFLNLLRDGGGNVVTDCVSNSAFGTTYKCASVGCTPEFVDWAGLFAGQTVFVSGNAIIPDSTYTISHLAASCAGNEDSCTAASAEVPFTTSRYGDTEPSGVVSVTDVVNTVDVVKQLEESLWEYQVYVRNPNPAPHLDATNVTDIVLHVDALKLVAYPLPISGCP